MNWLDGLTLEGWWVQTLENPN